MSKVLHFYRFPGTSESSTLRKVRSIIKDDAEKSPVIVDLKTEFCFNIEAKQEIDEEAMCKLLWLFTETFEPENVRFATPFLTKDENPDNFNHQYLYEVGPRLAFSTAWSSNCSSMMRACGIDAELVGRTERNRRYKLICSRPLTNAEEESILHALHDRMTECIYSEPLVCFQAADAKREKTTVIPILEEGRAALEHLNKTKGLGFDEWDLDFYTSMFRDQLCRNPTDVECFDMAQSNSEHSRHWFFGGRLVIDGVEQPQSLFQLVKATLTHNHSDDNSIIAFHDNSSVIRGYHVPALTPSVPGEASCMTTKSLYLHPLLTAETHNFPTAVAPFAGAETGTGGRLRDVQATGRGAHSLAGISAYCVGHLPLTYPEDNVIELGYDGESESYPTHLASPLQIIIDASNGASDYGNKYGEPVIAGFARAFGQRVFSSQERVEWIKPIMFTAGIGLLDDRHKEKGQAEPGMLVCKLGGPAYRIGMGGGAASSRSVPTTDDSQTNVGTNSSASSIKESELDFNAVQRGDAEMENRLNRLIRTCVELGENNPIVSIHDQGAGGNGNVLKEIVAPHGAVIHLNSLLRGDDTLSALELWGAEYQENNAVLVKDDEAGIATLLRIAEREQCPVSVVGTVNDTGRMVVVDDIDDRQQTAEQAQPSDNVVVDLPLELVLGDMPRKVFHSQRSTNQCQPLIIPADLTVDAAIVKVFHLLDVGSKRFLTNKVDRSVTGLIAQQQCVGPLQTPLSNVAVTALSHFTTRGIATAVGEQPIKGLISPEAQARLTVIEAVSNLCFADVNDSLHHIKASGNWMWAAKLPGEAEKMWRCAQALQEVLLTLGVAIDGGKDSLSMAVQVEGETVKAPGQVTLTVYAACPDITKTVTPDLKLPTNGTLLYVDLSGGKHRLGGSAFATAMQQLGDEAADVDDVLLFKQAFHAIQQCIQQRWFTAGHDRSDGGLITLLLEMAIAGDLGFDVTIPCADHQQQQAAIFALLFSEEPGFVFEAKTEHVDHILQVFQQKQVPIAVIGHTCPASEGVTLTVVSNSNNTTTDGTTPNTDTTITVLDHASVAHYRAIWEATSTQLEQLQCHPDCVLQERAMLTKQQTPVRRGFQYHHTYLIRPTMISLISRPVSEKPAVCVLRQEGTNGDREMMAACHAAGLSAWDVNMHDLLTGKVTLNRFRGIIFCGGFSYADVNDSAKGWAAVIQFQPQLLAQFQAFQQRLDTFSLGVCNGCQLMALLGWVPFPHYYYQQQAQPLIVQKASEQPRFIHNQSGRFESRWSTVTIQPSPAVLLRDMAGSTLGIWVAHGEGKVYFPNPQHLALVEAQGLAPMRYVDEDSQVTEQYPYDPNGSPQGIAALCSVDGRHLAVMPHPERCFRPWQLPCPHPGVENTAENESTDMCNAAAPWMKLFQNALRFCESVEEETK